MMFLWLLLKCSLLFPIIRLVIIQYQMRVNTKTNTLGNYSQTQSDYSYKLKLSFPPLLLKNDCSLTALYLPNATHCVLKLIIMWPCVLSFKLCSPLNKLSQRIICFISSNFVFATWAESQQYRDCPHMDFQDQF